MRKWKPAGHAANRDMASASAYLMYDAPSDFSNVSDAWKGRVLFNLGFMFSKMAITITFDVCSILQHSLEAAFF